jgi:hypothetical protein
MFGDARFDRALLLLQAYAMQHGFAHMTVASWGASLHLIVDLPDSAEHPLLRFLSTGLADILATAGLAGWAFPRGCTSPHIAFEMVRFREFGVESTSASTVRLYPRRVAKSVDEAAKEVHQCIQQRARERKLEFDMKVRLFARSDAPTCDVFGDPVHTGAFDGGGKDNDGGGVSALELAHGDAEDGLGTDEDEDDAEDEDEEEEDEDEEDADEDEDDIYGDDGCVRFLTHRVKVVGGGVLSYKR